MFLKLLLTSLVLSVLLCVAIERAFQRPIGSILDRLVSHDMSPAWLRYLRFAIYVVGISGGVRFWELEKYITGSDAKGTPLVLNADRWTLELYKTIIGTLQSVAWMLLVFFVFALVAYVVVRSFEARRSPAARPGA